MVFIKLEESGYIYFEIFMFYFSLPKGRTIHQELLMNRFHTYRNVSALPGKRSGVAGHTGNKERPRAPALVGEKKSQITSKKGEQRFCPGIGLTQGLR